MVAESEAGVSWLACAGMNVAASTALRALTNASPPGREAPVCILPVNQHLAELGDDISGDGPTPHAIGRQSSRVVQHVNGLVGHRPNDAGGA